MLAGSMALAMDACSLAFEAAERAVPHVESDAAEPRSSAGDVSLAEIGVDAGVGAMAYGDFPYDGPQHPIADFFQADIPAMYIAARIGIPAMYGRARNFLFGEPDQIAAIPGPHSLLARFGNIGLPNTDNWLAEKHRAENEAREKWMNAALRRNGGQISGEDPADANMALLAAGAFAGVARPTIIQIGRAWEGRLANWSATDAERLAIQSATSRTKFNELLNLAKQGDDGAVEQLWRMRSWDALLKTLTEGTGDAVRRRFIVNLVEKSANNGAIGGEHLRKILNVATTSEEKDVFFLKSMDLAKKFLRGNKKLLARYETKLKEFEQAEAKAAQEAEEAARLKANAEAEGERLKAEAEQEAARLKAEAKKIKTAAAQKRYREKVKQEKLEQARRAQEQTQQDEGANEALWQLERDIRKANRQLREQQRAAAWRASQE